MVLRIFEEEADDFYEELAKIDPIDLAPAVRLGIAPIMNANPTKTFRGAPCKEEWSKEQKKLLGCWHKNWIIGEVKKLIEKNRTGTLSNGSVANHDDDSRDRKGQNRRREKRPWTSS